MKENPYSNIIQLMQEQGAVSNPPGIQIGILISPPPNLVVKVNDLPIDKNNVLASDHLNIRVEDIGTRFAIMPVENRQLYIILAKLKEVS